MNGRDIVKAQNAYEGTGEAWFTAGRPLCPAEVPCSSSVKNTAVDVATYVYHSSSSVKFTVHKFCLKIKAPPPPIIFD